MIKKQFAVRVAVLSVVAVGLSGCAATQLALTHRNLNVQTKMSNTIFLPPVPPSEQTVYVQFKNTSDQSLNVPVLTQQLDARLESQGYRVVPYSQAHYLLQINVLSIGKSSPSAAQSALAGGYGAGLGSAVAGAAAGGLIGQSYTGAGVGGLVAGVGGFLADSMVKNVTYAMITDVQVGVRSRHAVQQSTSANLQQGTSTNTTQNTWKVGHWVDYRTRIVSTANRVNLSFKTALPVLQEQLVHSLGGIL